MDHDARIDAAEREVAALVDALRSGPLDAPVPTCPAWTVSDLIEHVGTFAGWWSHNLCEALDRPKVDFPAMPDGEARIEWFEQVAGSLVDLLCMTEPDLKTWTWVPDDQTASFVARRCAHELAIHRFDAQMARGSAQPVDAELAADGIEEIFVMVRARPFGEGTGQGETLHLHGTDRDDEWTIMIGPDSLSVTREHAKGDLAIRAAVSDLELTLYDRPTVGEVQRFGDEAVLDVWTRAFTFG